MSVENEAVSTPEPAPKVQPKVSSELDVSVKHVDGYGKVKKATEVTIRFAGKILAERTLGGEYNKQQALREFRRSQDKWNIKDSVALEQARQLKLL